MTYRRRDDVLWRHSMGRVLVLPTKHKEIVTVEGSGVAVWGALTDWVSADVLAEHLAARFGAEVDVVLDDLRSTLTVLVEHGIVSRSDAQE